MNTYDDESLEFENTCQLNDCQLNMFFKVCSNIKCLNKVPEPECIKIYLFNNLSNTDTIHYFCTYECIIEFHNKYYKFYSVPKELN